MPQYCMRCGTEYKVKFKITNLGLFEIDIHCPKHPAIVFHFVDYKEALEFLRK